MASLPAPEPLFTLRGDMAAVHSLLFQLKDESECLYASTQAGIVHKWNLKSCREEKNIEVSDETCLALKYLQKNYISQIKGGKIKIWEDINESWNLKTEISSDYCGFCKIGVTSDNYLICPETGSNLKIVSLNGRIVKTLKAPGENCGEIMATRNFTLSGVDYIYVLYENGLLVLFLTSGQVVSDIKITNDCPMALDFDGVSKGIVGSSGDAILGFELSAELRIVKWRQTVITNAGVSCVAIRPDKRLCAVGCWDGRVRLFSMKSLKLLVVMQNHKEAIQDVCFAPGRVSAWDCPWLLAAAGQDGRITLWNLYP